MARASIKQSQAWKRIGTLAALFSLVVLVGCSSDEPSATPAGDGDRLSTTIAESSPSTTEATSDSEADSSNVRAYFEALATSDVKGIAAAIDLTEPESPASYYAIYQTELQRLGVTGSDPATVEADGDVITLCETSEDEQTCYEYSDFTVNDDGLLVNFSVNEVPLTDRLGAAGAPATAAGVTAQVAVAYDTANGDLILLVDVKNDSSVAFSPSGSGTAYVGADGRQAPTQTGLTSDVLAGASAYDAVLVEGGERGGKLTYAGFLDDDSFTNVELPLAVP